MSDGAETDDAVQRRRRQVVDLVRAQGFVTVESLVGALGVTPQTVRRDVRALDASGQVRRVHGGAGLPSSVRNAPRPERQVLHLEEKRRIARHLAEAIPNGASLFINIGTTNEAVAHALTGHRDLRVITNSLPVASVLAAVEGCEVIVAGGTVRRSDQGIVGEATIDLIEQFRVDFGIIGISGIDLDGTLLDYDYREVRVAQAIMRNARRVFLATDHSKFGRAALVRLAAITEIGALFTDRPPPEPIARLLEEGGVEVRVAP